jgi:hypothetical protein
VSNPADPESPPPVPPSVPPRAVPYPAVDVQFGHVLYHAVGCYFAQWANWLVPVLLSIFIGIASMCGICLPLFLFGPLACGLFGCAFAALDGQQVNLSTLFRGWRHFFTACLAGLLLMAINLVPLVLLFLLQMAAAVLAVGMEALAANGKQAPQAAVFAIFFPLQLLGIMFQMIWTIWIGTRTMFVLPTIVDRDYSLSNALDVSWEATRHRFWELAFLNLIAILLSVMGMYLCYVGVILTMPLYFLTVAAAYDFRVGSFRNAA